MFFVAFLLLAPCYAVETWTLTPSAASRFLSDATLSVQLRSGQLHLTGTTPLAVACGICFRPSNGTATTAQNWHLAVSTSMSAPITTQHDILLSDISANSGIWQASIFAWLPFGRAVYEIDNILINSSSTSSSLDLSTATAQNLSPSASESSPKLAVTFNGQDASVTVGSPLPSAAIVGYSLSNASQALVSFSSSASSSVQHVLSRSLEISQTPHVVFPSLDAGVRYAVAGAFILSDCSVQFSPVFEFTVPQLPSDASCNPNSTNLALLTKGASISDVSSNYGNMGNGDAYGANHAIDGSSSTEWSSNGDGNEAYLTIQLAQPSTLMAVGFWTRTMGSSAQIFEYEVLIHGQVVSNCSVPDALSLHRCMFPAMITNVTFVKFQVTSSSGGNTGASVIEIYGCTEMKGNSSGSNSTNSPGSNSTNSPGSNSTNSSGSNSTNSSASNSTNSSGSNSTNSPGSSSTNRPGSNSTKSSMSININLTFFLGLLLAILRETGST